VISSVRSTTGAPGDPKNDAKAVEAARAVEGVFVSMLIAEMKKSFEGGGFFGDGPGSEVFDGMFDRLMGEEIAKKGGFGLADFVEATVKARSADRQAPAPATDLERAGPRPEATHDRV
jgi:Rod binding domain-containing protein